MDEGSMLMSLHKSMQASYNLYNKTRPSASKSSVARAKKLLEECGGAAQLQGMLHPSFSVETAKEHGYQPGSAITSSGDMSYIQSLRGFRPKIEKLGNVISVNAMRTMEQAKLDAAAVAASAALEETNQILAPKVENPTENDEDAEDEDEINEKKVQVNSKREKPRLSKKARKQMKEGNSVTRGEDEDFDIKVSGEAKGETPGEQFYLSTSIDYTDEARERGFDMEQYQMDLLPDDSSDIKKAKSVMRWDAKRKKYLPTMVTADGRAVKGQRRNESGKKVKGEATKSNIYEKWSKATKRRIQKVGEVEDAGAALGNLRKSQSKTVEFDASGEVTEDPRARKPIVPFHGTVPEQYLTHKQKRALKKRSKLDSVLEGEGKKELKTPQQIQLEKKQREKNKLKQKPWLRKQRAKQNKETRMKKREEQQMRYGARTKARMLIIEGQGPKQWKKRKAAPQKGYGSRHSF